MANKIDMVGRRFGRLTVIKELAPREFPGGQRQRLFLVRCDCGKRKSVQGNLMRFGHSASCGCLHRERFTNLRHGNARTGRKTREYLIWQNMILRCYYPSSQRFLAYGGRGIRVCRRWRHSFENFLSDMGRRPKGKSLDRINVNGNYTPKNCRWATDAQQRFNKRPRHKR